MRVHPRDAEDRILRVMQTRAVAKWTAAQLAVLTGLGINTVRRTLWRLRREGMTTRRRIRRFPPRDVNYLTDAARSAMEMGQ